MKFRFLVLSLLFVGLTANAQDAKKILNDVSKNYKKLTTFSMKFETSNSLSGEKMKGEVNAAGDKFNLKADKIQQIYDGKKLYMIDDELQEVNITSPKKGDADFLTPTRILDIYKKGFDLSIDEKKTIGGRTIQYIKLAPKKMDEGISYYKIGVDRSKNQLYQMIEVTDDGATTTITVTEQLDNLIIPGVFFKFNRKKYEKKGYVINEL